MHHFVISALLGHSTPLTGFGFASRITPGYAHATWDAMVAAVESLEQPILHRQNMFSVVLKNDSSILDEARKAS
ncbi:MAG: hypothetical protein NVSMB56_09500 [Pyrinomonadaceae bacterium]